MLQETEKGWPLPWIFTSKGEKSGRGAGSIIASALDAEGLVTPVATALIPPATVTGVAISAAAPAVEWRGTPSVCTNSGSAEPVSLSKQL
jgi:hypothetical protein